MNFAKYAFVLEYLLDTQRFDTLVYCVSPTKATTIGFCELIRRQILKLIKSFTMINIDTEMPTHITLNATQKYILNRLPIYKRETRNL